MTVKELAASIGKQGFLNIANMQVKVTVTDVRQVFGRIDFQITPTDGNGNNWVESSRVNMK
jgi:hypothetical protein